MGFGNSIVDNIFFVPGYDISGFVVSQVKMTVVQGICFVNISLC